MTTAPAGPGLLVMRVRPVREDGGAPASPPAYKSEGAAGLDLFADVAEGASLVLRPMERAAVPTGWAVQIPPGFEGQVRPRSGLALRHGVTVANAPGTIDSDYRGELQVLLVNLGAADYIVRRGDRIAQLVIAKVERVEVVVAERLDETARGGAGFGSTGR